MPENLVEMYLRYAENSPTAEASQVMILVALVHQLGAVVEQLTLLNEKIGWKSL